MIANIHPALVLLAATAVFTAHAEDLTLCRQGLAATQRQDNERAISLYDACVKLGDLSPSSLAITYRNYANTYRQMAKPQLSIEFSDKAIALHPRDVAADHVNRGNALSDLGRYNDALEGFNVAASLAPNLADVHYNRGIVFERMKQAERAKGEFLLAYQKGLRSKLLHERMSAHGLAEQGGTAPIAALATPSTSTAAAELPLAKNIGAVWNMTMQSCNGAGANAFQLHPSSKETVASKRVELRTLGAVLRVPQLPGVETTHIKLFLGDRTRGVVDNYVLLAEHDAFPPVAAVVITELPQQISTPDKALAAVAVLENQLIRKAGLSSKLERTSGPYGDALELVIRNRVGTHCFPTSDFKVLSQSSEGGTIGISRFVFAMGKLVEFSLIVRVPANLDEEAALSYSRELMDGFWLSLKPI